MNDKQYRIDVSYPKRQVSGGSDKSHEEEKRDKVVGLEDIMEDVYKAKFGGKESKKRSLRDQEQDMMTQHTFRSKSFKDGEEVMSEDSYLFQWKPDYITRQENYWDDKKDRFAC